MNCEPHEQRELYEGIIDCFDENPYQLGSAPLRDAKKNNHFAIGWVFAYMCLNDGGIDE